MKSHGKLQNFPFWYIYVQTRTYVPSVGFITILSIFITTYYVLFFLLQLTLLLTFGFPVSFPAGGWLGLHALSLKEPGSLEVSLSCRPAPQVL